MCSSAGTSTLPPTLECKAGLGWSGLGCRLFWKLNWGSIVFQAQLGCGRIHFLGAVELPALGSSKPATGRGPLLRKPVPPSPPELTQAHPGYSPF